MSDIVAEGRSPLAPESFPDLPEIAGVTRRTICAGYRDWQRTDLTLITLVPDTVVAGVFTRNVCCSSEVDLGRAQLHHGTARALVVNAGNSNAFTGYRGREAVEAIQAQVAETIDCAPAAVFVSSTGVIGEVLPKDKACAGIAAALQSPPCSWQEVAQAITTTDTFPKGAQASAIVGVGGDSHRVTCVGIVKGSGMIAPDMATMLGYIFTDAAVAPELLQEILDEATASSFNNITVDSDTSTSDTVLLFATGHAGNLRLHSRDDPGAEAFAAAVCDVARQLAQMVVRDGEGARKFIEITIIGATSDNSARRVGLSIANSPLVKTAIAGADANWGRVVMAVGKAGQPADRDRLSIVFGDIIVARDGMAVADYDEAPLAAHLAGDYIRLLVDLGIGDGRAQVWTCDLTEGYIRINADYRS